MLPGLAPYSCLIIHIFTPILKGSAFPWHILYMYAFLVLRRNVRQLSPKPFLCVIIATTCVSGWVCTTKPIYACRRKSKTQHWQLKCMQTWAGNIFRRSELLHLVDPPLVPLLHERRKVAVSQWGEVHVVPFSWINYRKMLRVWALSSHCSSKVTRKYMSSTNVVGERVSVPYLKRRFA